MSSQKEESGSALGGAGIVIGFVLFVILGLMVLLPQYNKYLASQRGQATLLEAESARQATVAQARANAEAALVLADASRTRANAWAAASASACETMDWNDREACLEFVFGKIVEHNSVIDGGHGVIVVLNSGGAEVPVAVVPPPAAAITDHSVQPSGQ